MHIKYRVGICLAILATIIPLFSHLDSLPIQAWDEARVVTNAWEMYDGRSNSMLVPSSYRQPEMWNTKPPLLLWLQVLCMHVFGVNELAVRLPSAMAALVLCLFLYWFFHRKMNRPFWGIITCLVLVTSGGYIRQHGTRTGDYDSLLTLFTTGCALLYYLYLRERKIKYLYATFVILALGVLTKGVAALLFAPGLLCYTLLYKKNYEVFKSKHLYAGVFVFLILSLSYYLLREHYNPGYLKAVKENELGGRYGTVLEGHYGNQWFYYLNITQKGFKYWAVLIPFGIFVGLRSASKRIREFIVFCMLVIASHFFIISTAGSKINWYDIPLYPFMSILAGFFVFTVFRFLIHKTEQVPGLKNSVVSYLFLIFVFLFPYKEIVSFIEDPIADADPNNMNMGYFLKGARQGKHNILGIKLVWDEYEPNLIWYVLADSLKTNYKVSYSDKLADGDTAAVGKSSTMQHMESIYYLTRINEYHGVTVIKVNGHKNKIALSIVVPVFNEEQIIEILVQRMSAAAQSITENYEIIFVNDGSRDNSLAKLVIECAKDPRLHYISFSRNFGHQIAITAGMDYASGDAIVTIDGDLQDPPELIADMYREYQHGFKVVYAKRSKRKGETFFKLLTAKMFYRLMANLVSFEIPLDVGDFRLISRDVLNYLKEMKEYDKYIRGQIAWLGFKSTYVMFERDERKFGTTNYPFKKMLRLAFNGITAFSDSPLKLATSLGFIVCIISFLIGVYALYSYLFNQSTLPGWASTIISITFLGGVQLLSLGIIGEYISRIINNVRERPLYVIDKTTLDKEV